MFDSTKPTLYLVRGVSGAGKSTFARILADSLGISCYEADNFFTDKDTGEYNFNPELLTHAHEVCKYQTECGIAMGFSVVVSNTSTTEKRS